MVESEFECPISILFDNEFGEGKVEIRNHIHQYVDNTSL